VAVNEDIRVKIDVFTHPKFDELEELCGAAGQVALIRLWGQVARHKPLGVLDGWSVKTIGKQAGASRDDAAEFVAALVKVGFLDFDGESYSCHDWTDHQRWARNVGKRETWAREMNDRKRALKEERARAKHRAEMRGITDTESGTESDTVSGTESDTVHHPTSSYSYPNPKPNPNPKPPPRGQDLFAERKFSQGEYAIMRATRERAKCAG